MPGRLMRRPPGRGRPASAAGVGIEYPWTLLLASRCMRKSSAGFWPPSSTRSADLARPLPMQNAPALAGAFLVPKMRRSGHGDRAAVGTRGAFDGRRREDVDE